MEAQVVFINEFDVAAHIVYDDGVEDDRSTCDGSEVSDLGHHGDFTLVLDDDELMMHKEEKATGCAGSGYDRIIPTETLLDDAPVVEDVVPVARLEPLLGVSLLQDSIPTSFKKKPLREKDAEKSNVLRVYRHHPYQTAFSRATSPFRTASTSPVVNAEPQPIAAPTSVAIQPKVMCCYFKLKGACKMGADCWYGHEGDLYTPCHYGAGCKAGHATLAMMKDESYTCEKSFDCSAAQLCVGLPSIRIGW